MAQFSLAIVGAGPMATYAMERLAALLTPLAPSQPIAIHVFEATGGFGDGAVHAADQPVTSRMNRIAAQIALGADETNVPAGELLAPALRPSFEAWCAAKLALTGDPRFLLSPTDMPPRNLHGQALREQFALYKTLLEDAGVEVALHAETVTDVEPGVADGLIVVTPAGRYRADHVLFVTGHGLEPPPGAGRIADGAYPLDRQLDHRVAPGQRVAIDGMGLTAIDVILHLTEGRGGRFVEEGGELRYRPSGREPATIVPFGASGHFIHSRPHNSKAGDPSREHQGVFLTLAAVRALRGRAGAAGQLDFERHVMPLVVLEMAYLYDRTLLGQEWDERLRRAAGPGWEAYLADPGPGGEAAYDRLVAPLHAVFEDWARSHPQEASRGFDWRAVLTPLDPGLATSGEAWRAAAIAFMRWDLAEAARGNLGSPVKAACDGVWRDLRAVFCAIVDDGGLTPASHRRFQARSMRHYNRLSNGAGGRSLQKMLALVEAGLVDISIGPQPRASETPDAIRVEGARTGVVREADLLIRGRIRPFDAATETGSLYPRLLERGLARRWVTPGSPDQAFAPGALDLDPGFHPRGAGGGADPRLTFLGAPAEGARFFQTSAARPGSGNYILNIVAAWARELGETIARQGVSARPLETAQ